MFSHHFIFRVFLWNKLGEQVETPYERLEMDCERVERGLEQVEMPCEPLEINLNG